MADSKRLAVLKALDTLIAATGVATVRGRMTFSQGDPLPMVAINESLNPDRDMHNAGFEETTRKSWLTLLVQGWAVDDRDHPTDPAYDLMAVVGQALAPVLDMDSPDFMLGGLVASVRIEPGVVRAPEQPTERAFFYFRVQLELVEDLLDPYRLT